jgi:hypothetical protein
VPTLDSQVLSAFLKRIEESGQVERSLVQGLSEVLNREKLPKAEDLVRLYSASSQSSIA